MKETVLGARPRRYAPSLVRLPPPLEADRKSADRNPAVPLRPAVALENVFLALHQMVRNPGNRQEPLWVRFLNDLTGAP